MAKYFIEEETLTNLGNKIRVLNGSTETMTPVEMGTTLDTFNTEISAELAAQDTLIADIMTALEGKTAGGSEPKVISISVDSSSVAGVYYHDASGTIQRAEAGTTFEALNGLVLYYGTYPVQATGDYTESSVLNYQSVKFNSAGGSVKIIVGGGGAD